MSTTSIQLQDAQDQNHVQILNRQVQQDEAIQSIAERARCTEAMIGQAAQEATTDMTTVRSDTASVRSSVVHMSNIGQQLLSFLGSFQSEMRQKIGRLLSLNWLMYQMLLVMQQNISRSPTGLLQSNIRFEDAMGEPKELPYEYFRH